MATLKSLFPERSQVATTATFSLLIPALFAFSPRFLGFLSKFRFPFSEYEKNKSSLSTIPSNPSTVTLEKEVSNLWRQSNEVCIEIPVSFALFLMLKPESKKYRYVY